MYYKNYKEIIMMIINMLLERVAVKYIKEYEFIIYYSTSRCTRDIAADKPWLFDTVLG